MTRTKTKTTTPTQVPLGELRPHAMHTNELGEVKILDLLWSPDPASVATLLPQYHSAAEELAELHALAKAARQAHAAIASRDAEAEDIRKSTFEGSDAIETRPRRVRDARMAAATATARHWSGLAAWQRLLDDVDLGVELRSRMRERSTEVADVLAGLDEARPVIEALDDLLRARSWLAPHRQALVNVTAHPDPDAGGDLTAALDQLREALNAAVADDPA